MTTDTTARPALGTLTTVGKVPAATAGPAAPGTGRASPAGWRRPDPDRDDETTLARALATAREASVDRLAAVGVDPQGGTGPALRPPTVAVGADWTELLDGVVAAALADDLGGDDGQPRLLLSAPTGLVRARRAPYGPALVQVGALAAALGRGEGATLVDVAPVSAAVLGLVEDVERVAAVRVRSDLHLGPPSTRPPTDAVVVRLTGKGRLGPVALDLVTDDPGGGIHPALLPVRGSSSLAATAELAVKGADPVVRLAAPGGVWSDVGRRRRWAVGGRVVDGGAMGRLLDLLADGRPHRATAARAVHPGAGQALAALAGDGLLEVTSPVAPHPAAPARAETAPAPVPAPARTAPGAGAEPLVELRPTTELGPDARMPDGELAAVTARAEERATAELRRWLPGALVERLTSADEPAVVASRLVDGDGWVSDAVVDALVEGHDLAGSRLEVARGGDPRHHPPPAALVAAVVPGGRRQVAPGPLLAALDHGTTVIIGAADDTDDRLSDHVAAVETLIGTRSGINAYLSRGPAPGFGAHWDDHDLLVVQVAGQKWWEVFEPTVEAPSRPHTPEPVSWRRTWEATLGPGDVVYLPRGFGHRVVGGDDLSVHFAIPLRGPRADLALRLAVERAAAGSVDWRRDLPLEDDVRWPGPLAVAEAGVDPVAHWRVGVPTRARPGLAPALAALAYGYDGTVVRLSAPAGAVVTADPEVLGLAGHLVRVRPPARDTVLRLLVGDEVTVADLPCTPYGVDPVRILTPLLEAGVLEVRPA